MEIGVLTIGFIMRVLVPGVLLFVVSGRLRTWDGRRIGLAMDARG